MLNKWMAGGRLMIKEMDLEDMAALKFCLLALGTLVGLGIPLKSKKPVGLMCAFLFFGTYIPLMTKFLGALTRAEDND